jgi:hypothetical protein
MKTTGLPNSFLLVSVRSIVQDFLALFRFTEADASALLSAYGLYALEADRLQNNRPIVQEKPSGSLGETSHRKRIGKPSGPIALGVHPDFTRGNWTTASRNQVSRPSKVVNQSQLRRRQSKGGHVVRTSLTNPRRIHLRRLTSTRRWPN